MENNPDVKFHTGWKRKKIHMLMKCYWILLGKHWCVLKLQLYEELCKRSVDGRGLLPRPAFWLSTESPVHILHLSPFVRLPICPAVGLPMLWAERESGSWKAVRYHGACLGRNTSGFMTMTALEQKLKDCLLASEIMEVKVHFPALLAIISCVICAKRVWWPKQPDTFWAQNTSECFLSKWVIIVFN